MAISTEKFAFDQTENIQLQKAALSLRAITHPLRLKMVAYIDKNKEVNVNKIYAALNLEQSVASQQLLILRKSNFVHTKRKGKYIYYSVNYDLIIQLLHLIEKYKMR